MTEVMQSAAGVQIRMVKGRGGASRAPSAVSIPYCMCPLREKAAPDLSDGHRGAQGSLLTAVLAVPSDPPLCVLPVVSVHYPTLPFYAK